MMELAVVRSVILYHYNVDPREQVLAMFPDAVESYIGEWCQRYAAGMSTWLGHMDADTLLCYVNVAVLRYGTEASEWATAS